MAPPHPHAGVNFVQPSTIQQYQNFEQLNMANPTHPLNNTKKKGRNRNNNNPGQGGNQPQQNQSTRGTRTKGIKTPRGEIVIDTKGEITIMLKLTSLFPFVVILAITPIIALKSLISNS
jgi:hypothetical protein